MAHYYTRTESGEVEPRHFVTMAKDKTKTRPSRSTDAKKAYKEKGEVWCPSVTTVLNILDKPALVNWKVDKHLDQAFELYHQICKGGSTPFEGGSFSREVKRLTREEMDKAPQAGTDIHKVLEDGLFDHSYKPATKTEALIIKNVNDVLNEECGKEAWQMEKYFLNDSHHYAGCADLVSDNWVIDYKSKQHADKFKVGKMQYPDHIRQLAAYGRAIIGEEFRAANIFICLETGEVDFQEAPQDKLHNCWLDFLDCLSIYKRNNYDAGKL